jgi:hypothetical protein
MYSSGKGLGYKKFLKYMFAGVFTEVLRMRIRNIFSDSDPQFFPDLDTAINFRILSDSDPQQYLSWKL